jgi:acetyltransferase-like isoleucine patch superfamily enzyme
MQVRVLRSNRVASTLRHLGGNVLESLREHRNRQRLSTLMERGRVSIGAHTYGVPNVCVFRGDRTLLSIGRYVSIGHDVQVLLGGNHRVDWVTTFPLRAVLGLPGAYDDGHPRSRGDIVIGNDVWLGMGCKILSGVEIGDGAVVGAFSVVTRSVRPYAIVAGQPAREQRRRFGDAQVERLLRVRWWDWPDDKVRAEVDALSCADIDAFLTRHGDSE